MNKNSVRVSASSTIDITNNQIGSKILLSLPPEELKLVLPKLELTRLTLHQILCEPGDIIKSGYFIDQGVVSVLAVQPEGKTVEVGLVGKEGFVGLPLIVGYKTNPTRLIVQGDGAAYRCAAEDLRILMRDSPILTRELHRFSQRIAMQTTQIAACNRLHEVEERLARWILMTQDRIEEDTLPLTQEFLAQMLGTRRSSVTVSAGILQRAGLISYTRGNVKVLDRQKLEEAACDCYGIVQKQLRDWEREAN